MRRTVLVLVALGFPTLAACNAGAARPAATSAPTAIPPTATAQPSSPIPTATPQPSPSAAAGWQQFSSASAHLSFRYPQTWPLAECTPGTVYSWGTYQGSDDVVFTGPAGDSGTSCPAESESPQLVIDSSPGAHPPSPSAAPGCGGQDGGTTAATAGGVTGTKTVTTYPNGYQHCIGGDRTKTVEWSFVANARTYTITFFDLTSGADISNDVDLVVSSLQFS